MATYTVLDVSKYNTVSNYSTVANNINGVVIRAGYRGYGANGTLTTDTLFTTHYAGFKDRTKIGVYWFTQAINTTEAVAEADYLYNIIKDYTIDFPIYLNSGYANDSHSGRADDLTRTERTEIAIAFCEEIKALGYKVGILASDTWFGNNLDWETLYAKSYSLWVAREDSAPETCTKYDGWQYTTTGTIAGISGSSVDLSYFYVDVAGWNNTKPIIDYVLGITPKEYTEDGTAHKPEAVLTTPLIIDTDYYMTYSNNIHVGEATATIYGKGNYGGSISYPFYIVSATKTEISTEVLGIEPTEYVYDGTAKEPTVLTDLTKDVDYLVAYNDNTEIGTGSVTVTGMGNYTGTVIYNFSIVEAAKTSIVNNVSGITPSYYAYDGTAKEPTVNTSLIKDTDYTITYTDNTEIGEATVTITGINNYTGTVNYKFSITDGEIELKNISNYVTKLDPLVFTYYGDINQPEVTVDGLEKGVDYTVTYNSNVNAGTGICVVTGINEYTNSASYSFTIKPCNLIESIEGISNTVYTYSGSANEPSIETELVKDTDYTVTYTDNINAGTAVATVAGINNYTGSLNYQYTINRCDISQYVTGINPTQCEWTGTECRPEVLLSKSLVKDTDYTLTYKDNIEIGTGSVTIAGINNYTGTMTIQFDIVSPSGKRYISDYITKLVIDKYTYDGTAKEPKPYTLTLTENVDYTLSYKNNTNAGSATCIVTGIGVYMGTANLPFTINPQTIIGKPYGMTIEDSTYTGEAITGTAYVTGLTTSDFRVTYSNNINVGIATYTITGINNYTNSVSGTFIITAKKLTESMFSISKAVYKWTGEEVKPEVKCTDPYCVYDVTYFNNVDIGTATILITAGTNYSGTVTLTFQISIMNISDCDIFLSDYTYTYDGTAKEPIVAVYDDTDLLVENTDYTKEFYNNINAGTATLKLTGKGSYIGETSISYTISPKNINDRTVSLDVYEYSYTGSPITPDYYISGIPELVKDQDYSVTYTNNIDVGTAKVTITGINNYIGTIYASFTIAYNDISECYLVYGIKSSVDSSYIIDNDKYTLYSDETMKEELTLSSNYIMTSKLKSVKASINSSDYFVDISLTLKGLNGYCGQHTFKIRALTAEIKDPSKLPVYPDPYADNGEYNFGDIDLQDESAIGDYDFGDVDEGIDPGSVADGDYDFNVLCIDDPEEQESIIFDADTEFNLVDIPVYTTFSIGAAFENLTGTYYIYNSDVVNKRVRICRTHYAVDTPAKSLGWCNTSDLISLTELTAGDKVYVTGKLYTNPDGTGSYIEMDEEVKYIRKILDTELYSYPYLISSNRRSAHIGYASADMLTKVEEL